MNYALDISEKAEKVFSRLMNKSIKQLKIINKKIIQIRLNPYHFKPLRGDMHGLRRVHIDKHFVLVYEIDEDNKLVRILDYGHHDDVY
ncbi:type II toxin-antitoxin system mRNA interferase toxin, RelE/StbE family [Candidatus Woesearchaeota archaeon]|jgi:YafQ family addiction module toxin component|nr:type II toxin-antitoxin system mRNA interferase toxin, RelE/StbE family [Candidatus Woesearchaeota archaeon]